MATPIISIPIDDGAFQKFHAIYTQYAESLKTLPEAWQSVDHAAGETGITMNELAAALLAQNELLRDTASGQKDVEKAASRVDAVMGSISKKLEGATKQAGKMTLELVKWGGLAGLAFAGLSGFSFLGIDKLAASASRISRSARGLGVAPEAQQAFGVNFGRYVSPDAMLSNTAEMQADMSRWGAFLAAGIGTREVQQSDPEQLSREVIRRARDLWDQAGPDGHTTQFMQAHGLDQLLPGGLQDWKRIGSTSRSDLAQSDRDAQQDRRNFALDPKALAAWTNFTNQMHRAGTTMEDVLIGKLAPLAGPLTELSKSITSAISTLLADPDLGDWIVSLGHGIENLATFLSSPEFKQDLLWAEDEFHKFVVAMGKAVKWIESKFDIVVGNGDQTPGAPGGNVQNDGKPSSWFTRINPWLIPPKPAPAPPPGAPGSPSVPEQSPPPSLWWHPGAWVRQGLGHIGFHQHGVDANGRRVGDPGYDPTTDPGNRPDTAAWRQSAVVSPISQVFSLQQEAAQRWNVPGNFATGIFGVEGGLNPDGSPRVNASSGAIGAGQLMPGTANDLKVNPFDTKQNIEGATHYMRMMLDRFHGNQLAAAAAYNWGPNGSHTAVLEHFAATGDEAGLPAETRAYVHRLMQRYGISAQPQQAAPPLVPGGSGRSLSGVLDRLSRRNTSGGSRVVIEDRTGGNAVVTSAQLAYG
jgi:hypothetical protein